MSTSIYALLVVQELLQPESRKICAISLVPFPSIPAHPFLSTGISHTLPSSARLMQMVHLSRN